MASTADARAAQNWLQERAGADGRWLPDAQELVRLALAADGRPVPGWSAWFDEALGYVATNADGPGDLVPAADVSRERLQAVTARALPAGGQAWIRDVAGGHPVLGLESVRIERRLAVLERAIDAAMVAPPGLDTFDPAHDREALGRLLQDAYATSQDLWRGERVDAELAREGLRPTDIVVVRSSGAPGEFDGAHWTMRRDGATGEVHNLSVHPRAQGRGLARRLLDGGLASMAAQGMQRVILWVDESNEPGMRLYRSAGFTTAWVDALAAFGPA